MEFCGKEAGAVPLAEDFFFFFFNLFLAPLGLRRSILIAARGLSLVLASGGYSLLRCTGFSLRWLLLLRSMGSRLAGSIAVARGL